MSNEAWSGLKAWKGCRDIAYPVSVPTSDCDRVTFSTPSFKSDFAASNHCMSAAQVLESGRFGAGLGKCHSPIMVQNDARMAFGAHTLHFSHRLNLNNMGTFNTWLGLAGGRAWRCKSELVAFGGFQWRG